MTVLFSIPQKAPWPPEAKVDVGFRESSTIDLVGDIGADLYGYLYGILCGALGKEQGFSLTYLLICTLSMV